MASYTIYAFPEQIDAAARHTSRFHPAVCTPVDQELLQAEPSWLTSSAGMLDRLGEDIIILVLSEWLNLADVRVLKSSCTRLLLLARQTLQTPLWQLKAGNLRALQHSSWLERSIPALKLAFLRDNMLADTPLSEYNQRLLLQFWSGGADPGPEHPTWDIYNPDSAGKPGKRALMLPLRATDVEPLIPVKTRYHFHEDDMTIDSTYEPFRQGSFAFVLLDFVTRSYSYGALVVCVSRHVASVTGDNHVAYVADGSGFNGCMSYHAVGLDSPTAAEYGLTLCHADVQRLKPLSPLANHMPNWDMLPVDDGQLRGLPHPAARAKFLGAADDFPLVVWPHVDWATQYKGGIGQVLRLRAFASLRPPSPAYEIDE